MRVNKTIDDFSRQQILAGLKKLPDKAQNIFKRMYSHENLNRTLVDVVRSMPSERLSWALTQVENTIGK